MKKSVCRGFIILILFMAACSAFSQTTPDSVVKSTTETVAALPDSAQVTFSTFYSDVKSAVTSLAGALKVGAEHVYEVLVKQQVTKSITDICIVVFLSILTIILFITGNRLFKLHQKTESYAMDDTWQGVCCLLCYILFIISLIVTIISLSCSAQEIATGFINPEYGAIQDIVGFVR